MNDIDHPIPTHASTCTAGAGRILATLILALYAGVASAQNAASSVGVGVSSSGAIGVTSFQNGADRADGPSSRVTLSSRRAATPEGGQSVTSSPPPRTSTEATGFPNTDPNYRVDDLGYVQIDVPYGGFPRDDAGWVGPVMQDERDRGLRRLSNEERHRLRSDIRDASRNMYDHPRAR